MPLADPAREIARDGDDGSLFHDSFLPCMWCTGTSGSFARPASARVLLIHRSGRGRKEGAAPVSLCPASGLRSCGNLGMSRRKEKSRRSSATLNSILVLGCGQGFAPCMVCLRAGARFQVESFTPHAIASTYSATASPTGLTPIPHIGPVGTYCRVLHGFSPDELALEAHLARSPMDSTTDAATAD